MNETTAQAALLRKVLKARFAGTKISVTAHRGNEFDAINVTWTNGPSRTQVEQFAAPSANTFVFYNHVVSA